MTILDEIFAAIAAALLAALAVLLVMNADLRADLVTANANASALGSANAELKDRTDRQNRAIAALQAESAAHTQAATEAVKAAAVQAKRYAAEADVIGKQSTPGSDDCAAAMNILRDYLAHFSSK